MQDPFQAGVRQTLSGFVPGQKYRIDFDVMRSELRNAPPTFEVDLNPLISLFLDTDEVLTALPTGLFLTELNASNVAVYQSHQWQTLSYTFTATASSHDLGFLVDSSDDTNPLLLGTIYLDNIRVVPEPQAGVLALLGGALLVRRRARR